jgi:hypothetical protein
MHLVPTTFNEVCQHFTSAWIPQEKTPLTDCVATYAPPLLSHHPYWHPTFKLSVPLINLLKQHTGVPVPPLHPPMNVCWFLTLNTQKSDNCMLLLSCACFQGGSHLGCYLLMSYFPSGRQACAHWYLKREGITYL